MYIPVLQQSVMEVFIYVRNWESSVNTVMDWTAIVQSQQGQEVSPLQGLLVALSLWGGSGLERSTHLHPMSRPTMLQPNCSNPLTTIVAQRLIKYRYSTFTLPYFWGLICEAAVKCIRLTCLPYYSRNRALSLELLATCWQVGLWFQAVAILLCIPSGADQSGRPSSLLSWCYATSPSTWYNI
jgi:hypothetical protein